MNWLMCFSPCSVNTLHPTIYLNIKLHRHLTGLIWYRISSVIRRSFFLPKQSQRSRSVLQDGSRSLGLFRKGKIGIIAKFHRTGVFI